MTLTTLRLLLLQPGAAGTSCWCLQLRQAALVGKNSQILCVGMGEERVQAGICAGPQPEGDAPGRRGVKEEMKPEEMRSAEHTWMCLPCPRGGGSAGVTCSGMTGG